MVDARRAGEDRAAATDPPPAPDPRRWKALAVCLVAGFMTLLDVSIVNVALPAMEVGIGATPSDLQWVVSGYALAFGLFLVPAGRTGDVVGRRTMFIAGVVTFGLASLLCGLAPNSGVLIVGRLLQGIGGGLLNPQVSGLIQELFGGRERGRAFGLLGATIGISTAVGPVIGGLIIGALGPESGWRWIFFVNLPIVVGAVLLALRWLPAPRRRTGLKRVDLDPVGVLLLGAGIACLLLPLVESERGGSSVIPWWLGLVGAGVISTFLAWESAYSDRGREPLVDLALFRVPGYSSGAIVSMVYFAGFTGIFFVLTIYFQQALGYSALEAGLIVTPYAAGSALTSALGGRLVHRYGRSLVTLGLVVKLVALVVVDVVLGAASPGSAGWAVAIPLLVAGLGSGLVISPNITLTLHDVPVARAGTAGGLLQTGQRIGTATGIALIGTVYFAVAGAVDATSGATLALRVAAAMVSVALIASVLDLRNRRREGRVAPASTAAGPGPR
jgi:EmrB/QacA subfamily drug resistance transporter